jgi:hypothetical protein
MVGIIVTRSQVRHAVRPAQLVFERGVITEEKLRARLTRE